MPRLIGAAQRVEHYEIAGYGTARAMAEVLGESQHVTLLTDTLEEEKETDEKLTELAQKANSGGNAVGDNASARELAAKGAGGKDKKPSKRVA